MFAFGICIGNEDKYRSTAEPALRRTVRAGDQVIEMRRQSSIHLAYNKIIDEVRKQKDLEGLILLHEDLEIRDTLFHSKIKKAFAGDQVGIVGSIGAVEVRSLAWWEGQIRGALSETRFRVSGDLTNSDVDVLDGSLLCIAPWIVQQVNFDETHFSGFHGYDADICFSVRELGGRVVWADLDLFHSTKGGFGDLDSFRKNDSAFRRKWASALGLEGLI